MQVVRHEPVAAGERRRGGTLDSTGPDRQRGQVETRWPALRVLGQLRKLRVRQLHAGRAQEAARRRLVHAKVGRPDLPRQAPPRSAPSAEDGVASCRGSSATRPTRASRAPRSRRGMPASRADGRHRERARLVRRSSLAAPRRGTTVPSTETPGDASASNTLGSIGEIRSSATATYVSRTMGSLSFLVDRHPRERSP